MSKLRHGMFQEPVPCSSPLVPSQLWTPVAVTYGWPIGPPFTDVLKLSRVSALSSQGDCKFLGTRTNLILLLKSNSVKHRAGLLDVSEWVNEWMNERMFCSWWIVLGKKGLWEKRSAEKEGVRKEGEKLYVGSWEGNILPKSVFLSLLLQMRKLRLSNGKT